MIYIEVTLVRLKETKEPVGVYSKNYDIVSLCNMIDSVCDPSLTEYRDAELEFNFGIEFHKKSVQQEYDEGVSYSCIESASMCEEMSLAIIDAYEDESAEWCGCPDGLNFMSSDLDISQRFCSSVLDVF